ncbi:MAG: leucine-rich repeat domain-containing protein [Clostridia bacterium]|nr:leucine-rich repeat domain-containing protein [Clostridia bacterium]
MSMPTFKDPGIQAAAHRAYSGPYIKPDDWLNHLSTLKPESGETLCALCLMPNLEHLILEEWEVTHEDVAFIAAHPGLRKLSLSSCTFEIPIDFSAMQNLTEIGLSNQKDFDLSVLLGLNQLTCLIIDSCTFPDLSILSRMTSLTKLALRSCGLTDISFLAPLIHLRHLDLGSNRITDIHALSGMTDMRDLDLFDSVITDATAILNMKSLRRLDMNYVPVKDKRILLKKPFSKLGVQVPDVPELEPADVRAERLRKKHPRVKKLCDIHSRVHFCRDAALVRLEDGMGRIALRQHGDVVRSARNCDLYFDDQLLVTGHVESGTSTARLYAGYGNVMTDEDCRMVRDALNADFERIDASLPALSPLLGLFSSGTYMIADFDLFPVLNTSAEPDHFWDAPAYETAAMFFYGAFGCSMAYDAPLYLFPTQPPRVMNPAQTDAYIDRLKQNDACLRSVAFYLNGAVALLLDGHHKAAAAAALGKPARTLVIFRVEDDKALLAAVKAEQRIFLRHQSCYRSQCGPLRLHQADGTFLCEVTALETMTRRRLYLPADTRKFHDLPSEDGWGRIPSAYCQALKSYPGEGLLRLGTSIPPDQIRKLISEMKEQNAQLTLEERKHLCDIVNRDSPLAYLLHLRAYSRLFPDSKWLTPQDRRFLEEDLSDPTWFPVTE